MEPTAASSDEVDRYGSYHPHAPIDLDRQFPPVPQRLASQLVDFFSRLDQVGPDLLPRSIAQFQRVQPSGVSSIQLATICDSLVRSGMLVRSRDRPISADNEPRRQFISNPDSNAYYCYQHPTSELQYGTPDHLAFGFPLVRKKFRPSVVAITGRDRVSGDPGIGTGFWVEHPATSSPVLVTARHCITDMSDIGIELVDTTPDSVSFHKNEHIDLAVLQFEDLNLEHPLLRLEIAHDLDEVLVMGFPPVPRFESTLLAETGVVAALQKSSVGEIAASEAHAYLEQLTMILATTRTKGGSSGGPMINSRGYVVGVVTSNPADADQDDSLGYTVALPSQYVKELLADPAQFDVLQSTESGRFTIRTGPGSR